MSRVNASSALVFALFWAGIAPRAAPPPRVVLADGRLSVQTERRPLRDVLSALSHYGVEVNFDAGVEVWVEGDLPPQPVEDALEQLLRGVSHVTRWNLLESPSGPLPVLAGIDVFRRGYRSALAPLARADAGRFRVARGPDGREFLEDEILLGLRTRMDGESFRSLIASIHGTVLGVDPQLGVYRVKLPPGTDVPALVARLSRHPQVAVAEPNYAYRLPTAAAAGVAEPAPARQPPGEAGGVAVAVLDSGLRADLDLGAWVIARHDATQPGAAVADPSGHGSQMALIATGAAAPRGAEGASAAGVPVVAVKAFDDAGVASSFSVMESLRFARENGARVVSLSWGSETDSAFLRGAVQEAQAAGLVVVAAAGNVPTGQPVYPAAYPGVLAAGALAADGTRWAQSNHGDFLTAVAPGSADLPVGHGGPPGAYIGTSISTPWIARAFSQYFTAYPTATSGQAMAAFEGSLTDLGPPGRDPLHGLGSLDAAALSRFLATPPR
jgi:hypothetical protein